MKKFCICAFALIFITVFSGCTLFKPHSEKTLETVKPTESSTAAATSTPENTFTVKETSKPEKEAKTPTVQATATPDGKDGVKMYVAAEKVNVRDDSTVSAQKIASLDWGEEVIAFKTENDWTYIRFDEDKYGYVATKYLSVTKPIKATPKPTAQATATPNQSNDGSFDLPEDLI